MGRLLPIRYKGKQPKIPSLEECEKSIWNQREQSMYREVSVVCKPVREQQTFDYVDIETTIVIKTKRVDKYVPEIF